jgi:hypothetical protein
LEQHEIISESFPVGKHQWYNDIHFIIDAFVGVKFNEKFCLSRSCLREEQDRMSPKNLNGGDVSVCQ